MGVDTFKRRIRNWAWHFKILGATCRDVGVHFCFCAVHTLPARWWHLKRAAILKTVLHLQISITACMRWRVLPNAADHMISLHPQLFCTISLATMSVRMMWDHQSLVLRGVITGNDLERRQPAISKLQCLPVCSAFTLARPGAYLWGVNVIYTILVASSSWKVGILPEERPWCRLPWPMARVAQRL